MDKLHFWQLDYQYRIQGHIVRSVTSHTINRKGCYNSVRWEQVALYSIVLTKYFPIVSVSKSEKKCTFHLSVNVFSMKVLIGDTIFYISNWRQDRHFTWSSEPREGLACCSAKGVPSFLGYFKTLSIGLAPGIEPATSRSAVNTLYQLS